MATEQEQIVVDIQIDTKDLEKSEKEVGNLTQKILMLEKQIKSNKQEMKKSDAELQQENKTRKEIAVTIAKQQQSLSKARRERTQNIKVIKAQGNSLNSLMAATNKMNASRNKQILSTKEGRLEFARLTKEINKNNITLKKYDAQVSRNQRNVGNYPKGLKAMGAGFTAVAGVVGVAVGAIAAFGRAMQTTIQFEKSMSKLKAISGATGDDIKVLNDLMIQLGNTTAFTAKQSADAATELAKLGFVSNEIVQSLPDILNLAAAFDEDLAESASVAAGTLRAFGLDASEMGRVVDIMSVGFTNSALDLEKWKESMKLVAPIAKSAGISIETTGALLGNLADNMLSGSIAGTGLKNLLSKLSNENSSLSKELGFSVKNSDDLIKAFQTLKERNIDLTEATELTDERSKAAFLTMIDGIDSIEKLNDAMLKADGTTNKLAKDMLDNLAGDITLTTSAWDGFMLSLTKGEGVISKTSRFLVQSFTGALQSLRDLNEGELGFKDLFLSYYTLGLLETDAMKRRKKERAATKKDIQESFNLGKEVSSGTLDFLNGVNSADEKINEEKKERVIELTDKEKKDLEEREKAHQKYIANVSAGEIKLKELTIANMGEGYDKQLALLNLKQEKEQASLTKSLENQDQLNTALLLTDSNYLKQKAELYQEYFAVEKENSSLLIEQISAENVLKLEALKVYQNAEFEQKKSGLQKIKDLENIFNDERFQKGVEIANASVELFQTIQDRKLAALDANEAQELANAGENEDLKLAIEKKYAIERYQIQKKQFIADKALQIANAGINIAAAVIANLKNPIMAALVATLGAVQLATIVTTPPPAAPTFANGGAIVQGGSHASGNDVGVYGDNGQYFGRVQGDEGMYVMKKESQQALSMSRLNQQFGGRSFASQGRVINEQGGRLEAQPQSPQDLTPIVEAISNLKIVTLIQDVRDANDTQNSIISESSF